jgi:hypothetical protein
LPKDETVRGDQAFCKSVVIATDAEVAEFIGCPRVSERQNAA